MDHLVGTTTLLRPYMHGYFVDQRLYEEARLISNPDLWQQERAKSIQDKINKERESRIRGDKAVKVKVNRGLAAKMLEREEKNERRKARRMLKRNEDAEAVDSSAMDKQQEDEMEVDGTEKDETSAPGLLSDPRFSKLFEDEDFEIDETSKEFRLLNPSTKTSAKLPKGFTAVEEEEMEERHGSSSSSSEEESDDDQPTRSKAPPAKVQKRKQKDQRKSQPQMVVTSSTTNKPKLQSSHASFGDRAAKLQDRKKSNEARFNSGAVVGEREISFTPAKRQNKKIKDADEAMEGRAGQRHDRKQRRSASGNVFRRM